MKMPVFSARKTHFYGKKRGHFLLFLNVFGGEIGDLVRIKKASLTLSGRKANLSSWVVIIFYAESRKTQQKKWR
jgi:hypothetical protein